MFLRVCLKFECVWNSSTPEICQRLRRACRIEAWHCAAAASAL